MLWLRYIMCLLIKSEEKIRVLDYFFTKNRIKLRVLLKIAKNKNLALFPKKENGTQIKIYPPMTTKRMEKVCTATTAAAPGTCRACVPERRTKKRERLPRAATRRRVAARCHSVNSNFNFLYKLLMILRMHIFVITVSLLDSLKFLGFIFLTYIQIRFFIW